jgi:CRISPR-associated protein Cmr1
MKIILKTLTPLWTGGVDNQSDRLHETGIIGSLRWWYEAIVRGLGGRACDPTDHTCILDADSFQPPTSNTPEAWRQALLRAGVCDACQAYGATGWARRFRLRLGEAKKVDFQGALNIRPRGGRQNRGWYLGPGLYGSITGDVIPELRFDPAALVVPLELAGQRGAIGARTQHGYGVVQPKLLDHDKKRIRADEDMLRGLPSGQDTSDDGMPSLRNMFFVRLTFTEDSADWWTGVKGLSSDHKLNAWRRTGSVPVSPTIRNYIRFGKGLGLRNHGQRNYVFGSARRVCATCYNRVDKQGSSYRCPSCGRIPEYKTLERVKTKLHISAAYVANKRLAQWQVRLWGWIPHTLPEGIAIGREDIVAPLYDLLCDRETWSSVLGPQATPRRMKWREFSTDRDQETKMSTDMHAFLNSLLDEGAEQ